MQYNSQTTTVEADSRLGPHVGIYGWRKRCLYALLLGLLVVVLGNLVATMLLLNVIHFNLMMSNVERSRRSWMAELEERARTSLFQSQYLSLELDLGDWSVYAGGLGDLTITATGVRLREFSYVLDSLITSKLTSRPGQPLFFEPCNNMSMTVRDDSGKHAESLHFLTSTRESNRREVAVKAGKFRVSDLRGRDLFTTEHGHVTIGADILRVLEGGVRVSGSVQTSMLKSNLGSELMLESATRKLYMNAPAGVSIESRAADISVSCLTNLLLASAEGKVKIKAPGIYIPNLESIPLLLPQNSRYFLLKTSPPSNTYQVCMCSNGKLFISQPDGECRVDNDGIQCR